MSHVYQPVMLRTLLAKGGRATRQNGRPCTGDTIGLLRRRHVCPSWIEHIGKEANRLEEVERGDVQDWVEVLERLLRMPFYVSPGWLRLDPAFRPLASHSRVEALVGLRPPEARSTS